MAKSSSVSTRKRKLEDAEDPKQTKVAKEEVVESREETLPHAEGTVYVVGQGDCGQLGLGEDVVEKARPGPVHMPGGEKVSLVCAGGMHTVCLGTSGAIYTWGVNDEGALGRYTEGEAWKQSGLAKGKPGDSYTPGKVKLPTTCGKVVGISAGDSHTMVLDAKGAVYGWGTFRDSSGVMGFKPGQRISVQPVEVWKPTTNENRVIKICSGTDHVVALCQNKTVLTWGSGQQGQLGRVGTRVSRRGQSLLDAYLEPAAMHLPFHLRVHPVDIEAGHYVSYAILSDGEVYSCGLNNYGQLGVPGSTTEAVNLVPRRATSLAPFKIDRISAGEHHALAITKNGSIISWGRPTYGRLGREDVAVDSDTGVEPGKVSIEDLGVEVGGVAAGGAVSGCFSKDMCGLWLCGFGSTGQLAKGQEDDDDEKLMTKVRRTKVFNEVTVDQLSFGGQHVVLLGVPCKAPDAKEEKSKAAANPEGSKKGDSSSKAADEVKGNTSAQEQNQEKTDESTDNKTEKKEDEAKPESKPDSDDK